MDTFPPNLIGVCQLNLDGTYEEFLFVAGKATCTDSEIDNYNQHVRAFRSRVPHSIARTRLCAFILNDDTDTSIDRLELQLSSLGV